MRKALAALVLLSPILGLLVGTYLGNFGCTFVLAGIVAVFVWIFVIRMFFWAIEELGK